MDDEDLQLGNEQLLNLKTELEAMDERLIDESCMNLNLESTNGNEMYTEEEETDDGNMIIMHLDIRESLSTMKSILQEKLSMDFSDFEIWLQDMQQLEPDKNLVDQCVQGEGLVQINIELKKVDGVRRINIVDVLKPQEDCLETPPVETAPKVAKPPVPIFPKPKENLPPAQQPQSKPLPKILPSENVTRWVMDAQFRKDQERLNIPFDPVQWSEAHVRHWLQWAVRQFRLRGIQLSQWNIKGSQLCMLSLQDFRARVPHDENDLFWTHLELLKKCKFVGVIQKSKPIIQFVTTPLSVNDAKTIKRAPKPITVRPSEVQLNPAHNKSGFNGQVQLWQFLLELLTDWTYRSVIGWIGTEGEFKLHNPELVAHLWGERKNKPNMNYEKLSRALRYYYDGDMISKVPAKRFTYKFVCNLQELLGYSAVELHEQVVDCERRAVARSCALR